MNQGLESSFLINLTVAVGKARLCAAKLRYEDRAEQWTHNMMYSIPLPPANSQNFID